MIARSPESRALPVALPLRLAAALLGGYAFVWGFVTLGIASLSAFGMGYDDAWMLMMMLAFLVYLGAILWANIRQVYFGCNRLDSDRIGFRDEVFYKYLKGEADILNASEFGREECLELFDAYKALDNKTSY